MAQIDDLIRLYQGIYGSPWEPTPKSFGQNVGQGRWYTSNPAQARSYAQGLTTGTGAPKVRGRVYSMDVPTKSLSQSTKFVDRLGRLGYEHLGEYGKKPNVFLATKKMLSEGRPSINWAQTLRANLGVAGERGLGFLKNYGARGLSTLGSLPFQAGLMTLYPTTANVDEEDMTWEDFQELKIMEDLFQKRRNIPGTPIVPVGDVSVAPAGGVTNIVATGDGGGGFSPQLDPGSPGSAPSWRGATAAREAAGKSVAGPGFGRGAYWAKGGLIDKPLSGRSRDI